MMLSNQPSISIIKIKQLDSFNARWIRTGAPQRVRVPTHPKYIRPTHHDSITYSSTVQEKRRMANILEMTMLDRSEQLGIGNAKHRLPFGKEYYA